jgi:hypothetical protein
MTTMFAFELPFMVGEVWLAWLYVLCGKNHRGFWLRATLSGGPNGFNTVGIQRTFGHNALPFFKSFCSIYHLGIFLMALGVIWLRRFHFTRIDVTLAALVGLVSLPFVMIVGGNRYMLPVVPLLILWDTDEVINRDPTKGTSA